MHLDLCPWNINKLSCIARQLVLCGTEPVIVGLTDYN